MITALCKQLNFLNCSSAMHVESASTLYMYVIFKP